MYTKWQLLRAISRGFNNSNPNITEVIIGVKKTLENMVISEHRQREANLENKRGKAKQKTGKRDDTEE